MKSYKGIFGSFLFILCCFGTTWAQQSKADLERERTQNQRKIAEASKILKEVSGQKTVSIGQLTALSEQIRRQAQLINTIQLEIKFLDADIDENQMLANALKKDLQDLKAEYARMIYAASKSNNAYARLMFLFSSGDFNQFRIRLKYLEQYADARKSQVREIEFVQEEIDRQIHYLNQAKRIQENLLREERKESESLLKLKEQKEGLVKDLNKKEKQLKQELAKRKKDDERLAKLIKDLIAKELAKGKGRELAPLTPEAKALEASFERNKNKLPWPVGSGFIAQKFGKNPHPILRGVYVENDGIDIQTNKAEPVRAVFDGTVLTVAVIPGNNTAVMVRHGNYISVYAGIKNVKVQKGQQVRTKDTIGEVYTDRNGVSQFQFQIWKGFDKLNPEDWLFKN